MIGSFTRLHLVIWEQHQNLTQKLRGHNEHYGTVGNFSSLQAFLDGARGTSRCRLSRRRRDGAVTWPEFHRLEKRSSLPQARVVDGVRT